MCQRGWTQGKRSFQLDLLDKISINHNDLNKFYYRPLVEQRRIYLMAAQKTIKIADKL